MIEVNVHPGSRHSPGRGMTAGVEWNCWEKSNREKEARKKAKRGLHSSVIVDCRKERARRLLRGDNTAAKAPRERRIHKARECAKSSKARNDRDRIVSQRLQAGQPLDARMLLAYSAHIRTRQGIKPQNWSRTTRTIDKVRIVLHTSVSQPVSSSLPAIFLVINTIS